MSGAETYPSSVLSGDGVTSTGAVGVGVTGVGVDVGALVGAGVDVGVGVGVGLATRNVTRRSALCPSVS